MLMAVLLVCAASAAHAQETPADDEPGRLVAADTHIDIAPDGTRIGTIHSEVKILKQTAIAVLGQAKLPYSDLLSEVEINEAYTLKANGQKIAVTTDAIMVQQSPVAQSAPTFTDQKQKVIIFPNVEVGDTVVLYGHDKIPAHPARQFPVRCRASGQCCG